jgi:hypothetical protein
MKKILKCKKAILVISAIAFLLAVIGCVLCVKYSHRHWNSDQFNTFYAHWDFFVAYLLEAIGLLLFFLLFLFSSKSLTRILGKLFAWISFTILCLGSAAVFITAIANCIGLDRVIKDYKLDCQLESDDATMFNEAIDILIPLSSNVRYTFDEPNQFILKAARSEHPKAQNAIGCFYHKRAKIALYDADREDNEQSFRRLIAQSESDFDHAIYWFLKAAQNNYGVAQTNLGRIFMGDLASNRAQDIDLAKGWFLKACANNEKDAFFYLGSIYSKENLRDAYVYWSKGAELGDENCIRALEKPEFVNGIPADSPINQSIMCDSIE